MTDGATIAIITGSFSIAVAIITSKLGKVSKQIDGRMDELLALTKDKANKEGNDEGRAELKQEQKDDKK